MQATNTPAVDARYWAGMLSASLLGTTLGDFLSISLGLGYVRGLPLMMGLLGAVLLAERRFKLVSQSYYWAAVVITRTAATNLADLGTHELKLGYVWVAGCLVGLLVATVVIRMRRRPQTQPHAQVPGVRLGDLPATGLTYWLGMLIASVLGTTLGDFTSDGLHWKLGNTSLVLAVVLVFALYARRRAGITHEAYYWAAIVLVRTTGTTAGDFLSEDDGLNLGFGVAAGCAALLMVAVLVGLRRRVSPARASA
jgi:uncharacterized membrane-anchored protein